MCETRDTAKSEQVFDQFISRRDPATRRRLETILVRTILGSKVVGLEIIALSSYSILGLGLTIGIWEWSNGEEVKFLIRQRLRDVELVMKLKGVEAVRALFMGNQR